MRLIPSIRRLRQPVTRRTARGEFVVAFQVPERSNESSRRVKTRQNPPLLDSDVAFPAGRLIGIEIRGLSSLRAWD